MRWLYGLFLIGVGLILYLSWEPNPALRSVWFIPNWVAKWTDTHAHESSRTGVPFILLSLLVGLSPLLTAKPVYNWLLALLLLLAVLVVAEMGQLFISTRHFDWYDIGWGAMGSLVGLLSAAFIQLILIKLNWQKK
ncbi:hypothetical protein [Spirosoma gilvum]